MSAVPVKELNSYDKLSAFIDAEGIDKDIIYRGIIDEFDGAGKYVRLDKKTIDLMGSCIIDHPSEALRVSRILLRIKNIGDMDPDKTSKLIQLANSSSYMKKYKMLAMNYSGPVYSEETDENILAALYPHVPIGVKVAYETLGGAMAGVVKAVGRWLASTAQATPSQTLKH